MIRCANCGKPLPWKKFKPHYKDSGTIALRNRPLCCYQTTCFCGSTADWNKDYVREEWIKAHPDKKVLPLIN